jgi:serine/threonine protein kinase
MVFLLSSENIFPYLLEQGICKSKEHQPIQIEPRAGKNFNLRVSFAENCHFLVKQECHDLNGKTRGEFYSEWRIQELLKTFSDLDQLRSLMSEAVHFDPERSIIVLNYFQDYCDLGDFYDETKLFPIAIATAIGGSLALIHRATLGSDQYRDFLSQKSEGKALLKAPNFVYGLDRVKPEVFGMICVDDLEFFKLMQRYDSLKQAIIKLSTIWTPCCLIHRDLRLNNILLHQDWQQILAQPELSKIPVVRIIDWEFFTWGDPAFDLGKIIFGYLKLWLSSLIISPAIDIETALRLAAVPLEILQPTLMGIIQAYLTQCREITDQRPDFLMHVMQYTGFLLIEKVRFNIEGHHPFNNRDICMLQVAKNLLCRPEESLQLIFGITALELMHPISLPLQAAV